MKIYVKLIDKQEINGYIYCGYIILLYKVRRVVPFIFSNLRFENSVILYGSKTCALMI